MLCQAPGQWGGPVPALPSTNLPAQKAGRDLGQGRREVGGRYRKGPEREMGNKKVKKGEFVCEL